MRGLKDILNTHIDKQLLIFSISAHTNIQKIMHTLRNLAEQGLSYTNMLAKLRQHYIGLPFAENFILSINHYMIFY